MTQPCQQRRRNCRPLYLDAYEARDNVPGWKLRFELDEPELVDGWNGRRTKAIPTTAPEPALADKRNYYREHLQVRRQHQQYMSDIHPPTCRYWHLTSIRAHQEKAPFEGPKEEVEPTSSQSTAGDAHAHVESPTNLSCNNQPHHVTDQAEKNQTKVLEAILTQAKHPAQAEWEQLWYHSTVAAYEKIAHYFPISLSPISSSAVGQSISEPTLSISSLNKEDQAIFKKEESVSSEPFAPVSEADRVQRLRRAAKASNERQRLALLLGLPTFGEYVEQRQAREQPCRDILQASRRQLKRQAKFAEKSERKRTVKAQSVTQTHVDEGYFSAQEEIVPCPRSVPQKARLYRSMTQENSQAAPKTSSPVGGAEHRPLVVGLTKPPSARSASTMASNPEASALNKEMAENVKENTTQAAPSAENSAAPKPKKEKAPKQPKPQKAAAPSAPTSPALIDLRVGHILRAIAHPNADSLYVSTIAMGDAEGAEHTQVDEETGKVVRTVCSGLNGLVPLEEMQNRKVIVVANLKPVNMRSIKSAAMVLAASPKQPEGADPHAADRVVELVSPPEHAEAGDKVYFEGWPYGEGKGPEKQLNPKKKQWEAIQPGFYTSDDLVVGFDASQCEEVEGSEKGNLVVEGKGACKVKTLQGAVVR